jgi:ATP-dependent exoDNAse (exonuclease V) alpha subunit
VAIYHLNVGIIKRSSGRSSVAAAAYRAGEKIRNEHDGMPHDYTKKRDVIHSEIMLPENAPYEFSDRAILWNAVEKSEKRIDSQTAREFDIALPVEFDREEQIEIMREYVQENFVDRGMCADLAIHDKGDGNPHAHVMLTTRHVTQDGFGGKNRDWNNKELLNHGVKIGR